MCKFIVRISLVIFCISFFTQSVFAGANPANDDTSGSVVLALGITNTGGNVAHATATTGIPTGCAGTPDDDVWYRFSLSVLSKSVVISLSNIGSNLNTSGAQLQLFSLSSGTLVSSACGSTSLTLSNQAPGTYYVRVYSAGSNGLTSSAGFSITAWASPKNDEYSNATLLTSSTACVTNTDNLYLATSNISTTTGCAISGTHYDVWYSFVAANTTETISISNAGTSLTSAELQLYDNTFGSLQCNNTTTLNTTGLTLTATGLTLNTTYYVRFSSVGNDPSNSSATNNFDICLTHPTPPPANDDCLGAITLVSSTTACTSPPTRTLASATNSGIAANSCGGTPDDDVWFKFAALGSRTTINLTNIATGTNSLASAGVGVEVFYSATSNCGALTYISCGSFPSSSTAAQSLSVFTEYTTGTYYVRVFSIASGAPTGAATFSICITHSAPPTNDNCAGATTLTIGTTNTSGTLWSATNSGIAATCSGTPDDEVWYKFTANATTATITLSSVASSLNAAGTMMQLFSGSCGALVSLACDNSSIYATGLTNGASYYVRVYSSTAGFVGTASSGSTFSITVSGPVSSTLTSIGGSRMNEVFQQTTLSGPNLLYNPWEITYGPDGYLWITESRGYKVYRMDPNTGARSMILDISQGSQFLPATDQSFNLQFDFNGQGNPQGGLAGLALHPKFLDPVAPKNYVYLSYIHLYNSTTASNGGVFFTNSLVRFTYNTTTNKLESPIAICDTLPGSSDHNSQRMIVAPVNGTDYLFYAQGDMGAGQFGNANRIEKAQINESYEGKILRFNLEPDSDPTPASPNQDFDKWIPNDNPFNTTLPAKQSAVWSTGIRNNQGFASININGTDYLYGSSHGPFSDDEINIIQRAKNYGHPIVIGKNDGNYDNAKAGINTGSLPLITTEAANVTAINTNAATLGNGNTYQDPIFSFYPVAQGTTTTTGTIQYIYNQFNTGNQANGGWPSEAPSGMEVYKNTVIPGWKNSLVIACLKWGRVMRLKLSADGLTTMPTNSTSDTISYFNSANRYRDLAFAPNGKDLFLVMDGNGATSGPSAANPSIQACPGCVIKYTFLGYTNNASSGNRSTIPTSISVTTGTNNTCNTATSVTIDATNNNLWVPITGPDGNILAEIKANGNNLGTVTASFYTNSGTVRKTATGKPYLDRNMTITPQNQPTSGTVDIRLYITNSELNALQSTSGSGVASVSNLYVYKNTDGCGSAIQNTPISFTPAIAEGFGSSGYVLQTSIPSFSSFYFAGSGGLTTLPVRLVTFTGALQGNDALLQWETASEQNVARFVLERSTDAVRFEKAGTVNATGDGKYAYTDKGAALLPVDLLYYRLKTIDKNGAYSYSSVVALHPQHNFDVMVFPNPVKSVLSVRINNNDSKEVTVQVTDVQGRVVYLTKQALHSSINTITIDVRHWNPQLYVVKVVNEKGNVLTTQKFEKAD